VKVVLTGGGTGGHIYPALSVAQALRDIDHYIELLFVGSSHGPEGDLAREAGIPFKAIPSLPLTRAFSFRNVQSLIGLAAGVPRARRILRDFAPDVAIGTGGYTTAAVLIAQRLLGGKIVIHEQNAIPGRTNRLLGIIADRVCVTFNSSADYFSAKKVVVTGMPIRKEFASLPEKPEARSKLGLRVDAFTILVIGGSQGARRLNELMFSAWPMLNDGATQVVHQVGDRNVEQARSFAEEFGSMYRVETYVDAPLAMAAADLVVCRSGASTLAEITAVGLPSIQVPYPYAYADHQKRNAEYLVSRGAAILCEEQYCTSEHLASLICELRSNSEKLGAMASASAAAGRPDAARTVAEVAMSLAGK